MNDFCHALRDVTLRDVIYDCSLAETTSVVEKEGEEAIYTCKNPEYMVYIGSKYMDLYPEFKLKCGSDGFFPMLSDIGLSEWPKCRDPEATTIAPTTEKPLDPCQCIGDIPIGKAVLKGSMIKNSLLKGSNNNRGS